jgi:hypothetical protein
MTQGDVGGLEVEKSPEHIRELALACEEYVRRSVGTPLDGTPETLPLLDHYLRQLPATELGPLHRLVVSAAGAYFGEVVRSLYDCRWFAPKDEPHRWRLEFGSIVLHFNPAAVVYEAITRTESGLGAGFETRDEDQQVLQSIFEALPPVRADDFFTLGLRLEVLARVVSELTLLERARGAEGRYDAADYRAALDEE